MQNVVEIIVLFVFLPTITSKYVYQLSEKTSFLSCFDIFGLIDLHFQGFRCFYILCLLELWGLQVIKLEKSSNKFRYCE